MLKRILVFLLLLTSIAYAEDTSNGSVRPRELNNPAVSGSRQSGSEQMFGQTQVPSGNYVPKDETGEQNNPAVGGRQSGSEQLFGQSATPSDSQDNNNNQNNQNREVNNPAVGGRQSGSEQLFGQSAEPN